MSELTMIPLMYVSCEGGAGIDPLVLELQLRYVRSAKLIGPIIAIQFVDACLRYLSE